MKPKRTKSDLVHKTNKKIVPESSVQPAQNNEKQHFKFISEEYSKYLKCPLCMQLMIRPMRFHPCGHTFCFMCIGHLIEIIAKRCPLQECNKKCQEIQVDRTAQSLIDELKVACTNDGCVWKGEYDNYKKSHKQSCVLKDMGLNRWLSQLTKGITIRSRTSQDLDQKNPQRRIENLMQLSTHSLIEFHRQRQQECQEKKQIDRSYNEAQSRQHFNNSNIVLEQPQDQQKLIVLESTQQKTQKQQQIKLDPSIQHQSTGNNLLKSHNLSFNYFQSNLIQTQNNQLIAQSPKIQLKQERKSTNHSHIINIPFGPSLQQQIERSNERKSKNAKKQLKKLQ